ncbi:MAG: hypothetical protein EBU49_00425 [Proteobacteria bacterium]|nr:hypothetical protein [Pseudomonadota bacterium]
MYKITVECVRLGLLINLRSCSPEPVKINSSAIPDSSRNAGTGRNQAQQIRAGHDPEQATLENDGDTGNLKAYHCGSNILNTTGPETRHHIPRHYAGNRGIRHINASITQR